ncbi:MULTISPECIES: hypothetical protein [unclassified Schlesneria]|uniref:hypothetical protein n=1 Tax=Schlesneria TaxID=656899 RepID=UPI002EDD61ED
MKDERQQLRDWIEKVADLQDAPVYLFIKASVQLMDGNSEDSVNITLFPRKLLSAMDAWDHDEIFEDSLVDCMG